MRTAFIDALTDVAAGDPRVMLVVGDLGFGVVGDFARRFPAQFLNAGVAEQNMTGLAAGLAMSGKIVFTYSIANFPTLRCLEQIRNDVCYHGADVKVVSVGGGLAYGSLGMSHHATEDLAILRALPEMTVVSPGDPIEAACAVRAIVARPGPCYLRLGRAGEPVVHAAPLAFEIGRAIPVRDGDDATLIATGGMLPEAVAASDALRAEGLSVGVLSMHTIKPLDRAAIVRAARRTRVVLTVEEHSILGGLGGAVAEVLAESGIGRLTFRRVGLPSEYSTLVGDRDYLRRAYGLDATGVAATVRATWAGRRRPRPRRVVGLAAREDSR